MRRSDPLHILFVASEVAPFAKTGGLADVMSALPSALADLNHEVTVVMPRYRGTVPPSGAERPTRLRLGALDLDVVLHEARLSERHRLVMVDAPALYNRGEYYGESGHDYADNAQRFAALAVAALDYADRGDRPAFDIVHAHDWQAGLVPTLVRMDPSRYPSLSRAGIVFTIHNLAYQGVFARDVVPALGLPWSVFNMDRGEFWGQFSFLKAGITFSDIITTVSPTHARETLTSASGVGMEGVLGLRAGRYVGILNGIDVAVWNPETDPHLPAHYSAADPTGKLLCKRALLARLGLPMGDNAMERPLVGMVSRLEDQKGIDLVTESADELVALDATWVFLGQGHPRHEDFLRGLAARHPARVAVHVGHDEPLAHLIQAGADLLLMPSRFEPCGLAQMYGLRYGAVPVVTPVGGLDDTIRPYARRAKGANGFKLQAATAAELVRTLRQATRLFRDKARWAPLMRRGMTTDLSWRNAAGEYVKVYRQAREIAAIRGGL